MVENTVRFTKGLMGLLGVSNPASTIALPIGRATWLAWVFMLYAVVVGSAFLIGSFSIAAIFDASRGTEGMPEQSLPLQLIEFAMHALLAVMVGGALIRWMNAQRNLSDMALPVVISGGVATLVFHGAAQANLPLWTEIALAAAAFVVVVECLVGVIRKSIAESDFARLKYRIYAQGTLVGLFIVTPMALAGQGIFFTACITPVYLS